jgi:hypothetical protein
MNAAQESSSTDALTIMLIRVSFLRIGRSLNAVILSTRPRIVYDSCEPKQLGAEFQSRAFRGFHVYLEPDALFFDRQVDHSAAFREAIHVADRKDGGFVQHFKDPLQTVPLRRADK